jgi:hypothetical protein
MDFLAWFFGFIGMSFGIIAYARVGALEKKLKESGVLDQSFNSEEEIEKNT